ncbi:hypothetical protein [Aureimonas sp. ME7]|uniref:hypothetical protein n=1 Tax=Aureimonas sp. ME7 TaxID=2744252 RepID=UPI0015F37774|nr:hypothetical protein [Aureimonas sp. ME7]
MADRIETTDELKKALAAASKAGSLDVRVEVREARETFDVSDTVTDVEIHRAITDVIRSGDKPKVVFVLGGGLVVSQLHLPEDEPYSIEDEQWSVERDLTGMHGGKVWLSPAPDSASGYGILDAFRMPAGEYGPTDWPLVKRFGVECGKFQQSRERVAA